MTLDFFMKTILKCFKYNHKYKYKHSIIEWQFKKNDKQKGLEIVKKKLLSWHQK